MDIRALQLDFRRGLTQIVEEEVQSHFGAQLASSDISSIRKQLVASVYKTLDATSSVDAPARMEKVAAASSSALVDHFVTVDASALSALPAYREAVARRATFLINELREDYLSGKKGPAPASAYLHKTRPVYEFVRIGLGVRMHGSENQNVFANGLGVEEVTIGQNVSLIHEVRCFFVHIYSVCLVFTLSLSRLSEMARCKGSSQGCLLDLWLLVLLRTSLSISF